MVVTDVPGPAPAGAPPPGRRRVPQQARSRDRVARILEVAARIVRDQGVESVSTRSVAGAAGVPVATLYQYFADKEGILLALLERDVAELDAQVADDLARLDVLSVRSMVDTTMRAFVDVYRRRPELVTIWFRGRSNPAVGDYCRMHNRRLARRLFEVARSAGMVLPDSDGLYAELAVEVADRIFQLAFESSLEGDVRVINEGIALVTAYLETHTTPEGIAGVAR